MNEANSSRIEDWNRGNKETQTEGILDMENLGKWTETTDANITYRIQAREERISGGEDTIEEINSLVKVKIKSNKFLKHPRNLGHHEMTKAENNRDRRRTPAQRHKNYIQQNHRRKLSQPKKGYTYEVQEVYRTPKRLNQNTNKTKIVLSNIITKNAKHAEKEY